MMSYEIKEAALASVDYSNNEIALLRKYTHAAPFSSKIICEFTTDSAMLYQYARLLDAAKNPWGVGRFTAPQQDVFDKSHVIVARSGLLCMGGARLTISSSDVPVMMPMEADALRLSTLFPQLDLAETNYAEISDVVVTADRTGEVMQQLLAGLIKLSVAEDVEYVFYMASQSQARVMQKTMHSLDINCEILGDMALPESEASDGVKHVLSIMDVSKYANSLRMKKREALMIPEAIA